MVVLPEYVMRELMTHIVNASHGLTDTVGNRATLNTISEPQLRMAAITAIQIATGDPCWPGDRKIIVRRRKQTDDIFEEIG